MVQDPPRIPYFRQRAVTALRIVVLVVMAGLIVGTALTYGRRGKPQATITMTATPPVATARGQVLDQSDKFQINGSREGRPAFTLLARTVTGFADEHKLLEAVNLTIHQEQGGSLEIEGRNGQFDAAARRAQLSGDVSVRTPDGLSLRTGTLFYDSDRDMIFTGDEVEFSVGQIQGHGRGLNYLINERQVKIPDQVRLQVKGVDGGPPATVASGDMVAALQDNTAIFTGDVRLERAGDVLMGHYLKLTFDESRHQVKELRAFGDVVATLAPGPDGRVSELRADSLTAQVSGPAGTIEEAEASGGCRVTAGPYTSRSRSAVYVRREDRIELRGDPVVLTDRERIAAQEIDLHPDRQSMHCRGEVRTVSLPGASEPPGGLAFTGRSALSFQATEMRADQPTRTAVYTGAARAWQEGNSLQADEIVIDQTGHQIRAAGGVMSRWTSHPAPGSPQAARPIVTVITARGLTFDDASGVARYRGDVRLTRQDATLTADTMDAYFKETGGRRDLDRVLASGSVAMKRGGSFGTARQAVFQSDGNLLVLEDEEGLAEVVDAATGRSMRGRKLTYDMAGDRILTESENGGRTWITLAPESKDAPSVEPKTRH
jgi:LPS export ABC transporter protein LptC